MNVPVPVENGLSRSRRVTRCRIRSRVSFAARKYQETVSCFLEIEQLSGEMTAADYETLGKAYGLMEKQEEAIRAFTQAILLKPNLALMYELRGNAHSRLTCDCATANQLAIKDYSQAIALCQDSPSAFSYYTRGRFRVRIGEFAAGLEDYSEAIKLSSDFCRAYAGRGILQCLRLRMSEAEADFGRAMENIATRTVRVRKVLESEAGLFCLLRRDFEAAIGHFSQVMKACEREVAGCDLFWEARACWRRAWAHCQVEEFDDARKDLDRAFERYGSFPDVPETMFLLPTLSTDFQRFLTVLGDSDGVCAFGDLIKSIDSMPERVEFILELLSGTGLMRLPRVRILLGERELFALRFF